MYAIRNHDNRRRKEKKEKKNHDSSLCIHSSPLSMQLPTAMWDTHLIGKLNEAAIVGSGGCLSKAHVDEVGFVVQHCDEGPCQPSAGLHSSQSGVPNLTGDDLSPCTCTHTQACCHCCWCNQQIRLTAEEQSGCCSTSGGQAKTVQRPGRNKTSACVFWNAKEVAHVCTALHTSPACALDTPGTEKLEIVLLSEEINGRSGRMKGDEGYVPLLLQG